MIVVPLLAPFPTPPPYSYYILVCTYVRVKRAEKEGEREREAVGSEIPREFQPSHPPLTVRAYKVFQRWGTVRFDFFPILSVLNLS